MVDKDIYLAEKLKIYEAKEHLDKVKPELEVNERRHDKSEVMHKGLHKELPLTEILDCVDILLAREGRLKRNGGRCADLHYRDSML